MLQYLNGLVCHNLLQAFVLVFQFLEPLDLIGLHAVTLDNNRKSAKLKISLAGELELIVGEFHHQEDDAGNHCSNRDEEQADVDIWLSFGVGAGWYRMLW